MAQFISVKDGHQFIDSKTIDLPDGKSLVTEVVNAGGDALLVAQTMVGPEGKVIFTQTCGYCSGVLIGCLDCPGNRFEVNCVNRTVSCY